MASYDSRLLSHATNIAQNRTGGASEIAMAIVRLFSNLQEKSVSKETIEESLKIIGVGQPSMAIALRITTDLYVTNHSESVTSLIAKAQQWKIDLEDSVRLFSENVADAFKSNSKIGFFSYSSYVNAGISELAKNNIIGNAFIGKSFPGGEGEQTAHLLKELGWNTALLEDAAFFDTVSSGSLKKLILGCDGLDDQFFINKIGSGSLAKLAKSAGTSVEIWTSTFKFLPHPDGMKLLRLRPISSEDSPSLFGKGSLADIDQIRTEQGVFSLEKVREYLKGLPSIDKSLILSDR